MRFPGAAGGGGQIMPVQESRQVLEAEIEDIESLVPGVSPPLFIGMSIDPPR